MDGLAVYQRQSFFYVTQTLRIKEIIELFSHIFNMALKHTEFVIFKKFDSLGFVKYGQLLNQKTLHHTGDRWPAPCRPMIADWPFHCGQSFTC